LVIENVFLIKKFAIYHFSNSFHRLEIEDTGARVPKMAKKKPFHHKNNEMALMK
jgi:hypothetical protein